MGEKSAAEGRNLRGLKKSAVIPEWLYWGSTLLQWVFVDSRSTDRGNDGNNDSGGYGYPQVYISGIHFGPGGHHGFPLNRMRE